LRISNRALLLFVQVDGPADATWITVARLELRGTGRQMSRTFLTAPIEAIARRATAMGISVQRADPVLVMLVHNMMRSQVRILVKAIVRLLTVVQIVDPMSAMVMIVVRQEGTVVATMVVVPGNVAVASVSIGIVIAEIIVTVTWSYKDVRKHMTDAQ
jgi:hypothetical protein